MYWGLSLNETLMALAILLIIIDFFIPSDIPTHIAYVILSFLVGKMIDSPFLIKVLFAVLAWFAFVAFHYLLWRKIVQAFANTVIAPDRYKTGIDGLVGETGEIREVDGKMLISLVGDLWAFESNEDFSDGDLARVINVKKGVLLIVHINEEK